MTFFILATIFLGAMSFAAHRLGRHDGADAAGMTFASGIAFGGAMCAAGMLAAWMIFGF